jgi:3'-phosphoadenosine 5'-phosphosulfate sulfotransferase (PAPS reductase)/FAD synthetase
VGLVLKHIVSVSGGKDSTATYLRALERGLPFRAVAADTGNEHPATYEAVNMLSVRTGGPVVEWVKADFTKDIARKRRFVEAKWPEHGVPDSVVKAALAVLHPTGNPYLDLCIWKGRFPSRRAQFCTAELKVMPIDKYVTRPALAEGGTVISWQGVRAAESFERSLLSPLQRVMVHDDLPGRMYAYRPILRWTTEEVFAYSARFGVPPNPLYAAGCSRVGCFPCINASKAEIALVDRVFPEQIERLEEWERIVSEASKRGNSTFFTIVNDPVMNGDRIYREAKGETVTYTLIEHGVRNMVEWAKTDRGGRQFNLFYAPEGTTCATHGACE